MDDEKKCNPSKPPNNLPPPPNTQFGADGLIRMGDTDDESRAREIKEAGLVTERRAGEDEEIMNRKGGIT